MTPGERFKGGGLHSMAQVRETEPTEHTFDITGSCHAVRREFDCCQTRKTPETASTPRAHAIALDALAVGSLTLVP
jgi:hypothetical protein